METGRQATRGWKRAERGRRGPACRWSGALWVLLLGVGLGATATGASAQVDDAEQQCRCVDPDGNAIEDCSCFVIPDIEMPDVEAMMRFGPGDMAWSGRAARPRLGVSVRTDQDETLDAVGAEVSDVMEGGPAFEAGIREGDVLTRIGDRSLLEPLDADVEEGFDLDRSVPVQRLLAISRELEPGEPVEVAYVRGGAERLATVEVRDLAGMWGAWANDFDVRMRPRIERFERELVPRMERFQEELRPRIEELRERFREQGFEPDGDLLGDLDGFDAFVVPPRSAQLGLRLSELTPGLADYFGAERGVLVTDVEEGSSLGLEAGDVLLRIGERDVDSPARALRILRSFDGGESVTFRLLRRGDEVDVMGRLDE